MVDIFPRYSLEAANDSKRNRDRTVPIPSSITAVPGYPNKLAIFKIAASKYWQARCWIAGRTHRRTTKTTSIVQAQRFARWFYESLLIGNSSYAVHNTNDTAPTPTVQPLRITFGAVAAQLYANEQARADRSEFGKGSLRMLRNRLDAHILPRFGTLLPTEVTYKVLLEFSQYLSAANSSTTVSHYIIIVRKVLAHAVSIGALEVLPEVPKIKVRSNSRGEVLEVRVNPEDLGRVIGRAGRTAKSIRTVVNALADGRNVRVDVVDTDA